MDSELPPGAPSSINLPFVEDLYYEWLRDPTAVTPGWAAWFAALEPAPGAAPPPGPYAPRRDGAGAAPCDDGFLARVEALSRHYREQGHLRARLDPLELLRPLPPIALEPFGLSAADLDRPVPAGEGQVRPLAEQVARLEETYCRSLGVELAHLGDGELRRWLEERMERTRNRLTLAPEVRRLLLHKVVRAEALEQYLGAKFLGAKRFSIEGSEGLLPLLELLIDRAIGHGVRNVVFGMAHRGRLNVLANVLGKPLRDVFAEFRDQGIVSGAGGDVKYHLGYSVDRETPDGVLVHLSLAFNPSHLEWINTVVQGRVRAKQDRYRDGERRRSLPVLIHGDAAFAGQGIVAEGLQMSELEAYGVGGTVHVVINNQVGFTTAPRDARSTLYATGVARMLQIPILHVNGEDLEAVAQAVLLAVDFRQQFRKDVVIDLWCYRRHGHNEGDEPAFTQPLMVQAIGRKRALREALADALVADGAATREQVDAMGRGYRATLDEAFQESARLTVPAGAQPTSGFWKGYQGGRLPREQPATGVALERLQQLATALTAVPQGFDLHPKAQKLLEARAEMGRGARPLDWGMAEALAFASLAWAGAPVRLAGQDVRRGTFSHRHAVLTDRTSGARYAPLAHLREGQGVFEVRDSLLSEAAALGFEYGFSLEMPDALCLWEAQFGDFVNCAQVIIDQFLASGEAKWNRLSGLVLLLPHGMEGQGPEHSSARLERFLRLSVDDNWRVVNLTTPAQIFHALRRQLAGPVRKPLVVMSPKSLLRHPQAVSPLADLVAGRFQPLLPDPAAPEPGGVERVVLCSGKLFYDLAAARDAAQDRRVILLRLEELYPLPLDALRAELARLPPGVEVVWAQEEPSNMGAADYLDRTLTPVLPRGRRLTLVARPPSASPAVGSHTRHKLEQEQLVREALGEPTPLSHQAPAPGEER
ncbi:MAG: 2-oxoglutarate dehydrogenase E1 component [Anaeromyxobacter sp.]|nr:2-oxoglutarate dehydrogenase E1 component [Anaeromyxobacter sp.]MBL0277334.1 2-oxoglutarate dehydrogenase E1 component [Anaeromyxobacter sp.]